MLKNKSIFNHFNFQTDWLDGAHVVFGEVISGLELVRKMETCGTNSGSCVKSVSISDCGIVKS